MTIKKKRTSIILLFFQSPAVSWHLGYCHWSRCDCLVLMVKLFFPKFIQLSRKQQLRKGNINQPQGKST